MHRFGHFKGAAIMGAISAIDIALWDLKGQALGQPIHALLGGPVRRSARAYAHVKAKTRAEMVDRCVEMKGRGFTAIGHLNPFLDEDRSVPYFKGHARKLADAVDTLAAVRAAVGEDVDLCVEIHRRLTAVEAVAFAREIAPLRPMFYEDPIPPTSHDAMARVVDRIEIPVATGERLSTIHEFQALLSRDALGYARVSVCLCGGITGARKVAAMAEAHEVQVVPHNPLSPVSLAACLQLDAAIPNFAIQEYPTSGVGGTADEAMEIRGREMVTAMPAVHDGFITIPSTPGLGLQLIPDVARHFPPQPRPVHMRAHRDGSPVEQ
jgi:galactonate dehydratase